MNNWRQILSWKPIDDSLPKVGEVWFEKDEAHDARHSLTVDEVNNENVIYHWNLGDPPEVRLTGLRWSRTISKFLFAFEKENN